MHRQAAAEDGSIVKSEGDAFWLAFPSATAAVRAAIGMHDELTRSQANKGDDRFGMRIVITLGDVLHTDGDFFGDAVALAARIEAITPADEIYISQTAWLAATRAEVRATFVDAFALKGFPEAVPVYRIERHHRTETIRGTYIVWTDLRGFSKFSLMAPDVTEVEEVLDKLGEVVGQACRDFGGNNRFSSGDAHCLTFPDAMQAISAASWVVQEWSAFDLSSQIHCPMVVAVHKGLIHLYKSYAYSRDISIVANLIDSDRSYSESTVITTEMVRNELADTSWYTRLRPMDIGADRSLLSYSRA